MGIYSSRYNRTVVVNVNSPAEVIVDDTWFSENSRNTQVREGNTLNELAVDTEEYWATVKIEDILSQRGFDP